MPDRLSPEQRSYCMSRVKGRNTGLEKLAFDRLRQHGIRFRKHVKELPGKPDAVLVREKIAIFVDGDFWHGYRFSAWQDKLNAFWKAKIAGNMRRDRANFRALRKMGWRVIRIWQHQLRRDPEIINRKVAEALGVSP